MADCESTGDIQAKRKRLFADTIEQVLEAEIEQHLGYEKNSTSGNNSGNLPSSFFDGMVVNSRKEKNCQIYIIGKN